MPVAEHPAECDEIETPMILESEERRYVADLAIGEGCALLRRQDCRKQPRHQSQYGEISSSHIPRKVRRRSSCSAAELSASPHQAFYRQYEASTLRFC